MLNVRWHEQFSVVSVLYFTIGRLVRTEAQTTDTRSSMLTTRSRARDTHTKGWIWLEFHGQTEGLSLTMAFGNEPP